MNARRWRRCGWALWLIASVAAHADFTPPSELTVVSDFNYPPYLFTTGNNGELQGIIRDKWELWSHRTGVPVRVIGVAWAKAQEGVLDGTYDVIETLSYTEARKMLYDFSPPYAPVTAHVYFHESISGISDVASLRGFNIGAKRGSACANWLTDHGLGAVRPYDTSELVVRAASSGEIRLFCMDAMTAQYYLFKSGLADTFRASPPLYTTNFHWAVRKGREELRDFVQQGFEKVPPGELDDINARWLGNPLHFPLAKRYLNYVGLIVAIVLAVYAALIAWNRWLRARVSAKTAELEQALVLLAGQKQVLEMVTNGAPLEGSLDTLLRVIEKQSSDMLCSILLLDEDGKRVRHGAAPSLPAEYVRAIDGEPIGEAAGSCGTAAYRRAPVEVEDIATDPLWARYRDFALQFGLRACWSTPIFDAEQRVLGTFAIYFRTPRRPAAEHRRYIEMVTYTAAIAISKQREQQALKTQEQQLRDSEERLRLAVTGARLGTWHWDIESDTLTGSAVSMELLGVSAEARLTRRDFFAALHARDRLRADAVLRRVLKERVPYEFEFRVARADGVERWVAARGQAYFDKAGWARRMEGIAFDITERKLAEDRIRRLNRVYAMLSGINAVIVREHDWQELLREACRLAVVTGKFRWAWIGVVDGAGTSIGTVGSHGIDGEFVEQLDTAVRQDAAEARGLIWRVVRAAQPVVSNDIESETQPVLLRAALRERGIQAIAALPLVVAGEVAGVLVLGAVETETFDAGEMNLLTELASDIAFGLDHIRKEERINYLAYYDALTGLANQTLFHERLTQYLHAAQRDGRSIALCVIDLDHFKNVNDALGRHVGDALLVQFAERLSRSVDDATRVARLGADRFALVLPEARTEAEVLGTLEKKAAQCIGQPFRFGDTELRVAVKIGIALSPREGGSADTLFRNAEAALKRAKIAGERCLFYNEQMTERVAERVAFETRLRRAIEREEFVLYYQPKVDARTRFVTGVEALIRWHDPDVGLVLPGTFIPLLETTGLILDAGNWAIRRAVSDHAAWVALGLHAPRVAVNVSSLQLRQRDFVDIVRAAIARSPGTLDLEITESLIMTDIEANIGKLRALNDMGVRIAIDDFGTGYSSLGYLASLPAQVLKIDLGFIARMLNDSGTMTLVGTMISLAHSLGLTVVAEGVETEEQAQALLRLGCDELQGYLIDRPLPPDRLVEFLRAQGMSAAVAGVGGHLPGGIKH